jgi:hypothetical protein
MASEMSDTPTLNHSKSDTLAPRKAGALMIGACQAALTKNLCNSPLTRLADHSLAL